MQLSKFKVTASKCSGYMMVIYQDNNFKSVLNEFNPPLTEKQLNGILNFIPNDPKQIQALFKNKYGSAVVVEAVKAIGAEPALEAPVEPEQSEEYPVNKKIALWCVHYGANHKDSLGAEVKYKTGAAEAGKLKGLAITPEELDRLFAVYFSSDEWYLKPKSISNFVKKFNEIRALALAVTKPKVKTFPLPFDANHFNNLNTNDKREYWDYLRANGYKYVENPGRGGKWVKAEYANTI